MIEIALIKYLGDHLPVPVYAEYPEVRKPEIAPAQFVLIEKTGSNRGNRIEKAVIAIQSYADSLLDAATLNEKVKEVMDEMPYELDTIARCKLNTDYNFTDTQTRKYRYQAVYDITYYKEDV